MVNKKRIKRFYIMPSVWRTVTESQVFNWIKLFNYEGLNTDCISITNRMLEIEDIQKIEKKIYSKFYQYHSLPEVIGDVYMFFILFYHYLINFRSFDTIIFQTRVPRLGFVLTLLKVFPKIRIVLELRGAKVEERKYQVSREEMNLKKRLKENLFNSSLDLFIKNAHAVICVSNAMKNHYSSFYKKYEKKFYPIPGVADEEFFYYSENIRVKFRKKMNYEKSDLVFVYSGALNMKWEIPDQVFRFIKKIIEIENNIKFLIVTPDKELALKYSEQYKIKEHTKVLSSSFEHVNNYLNCGDFGLLLREKVLMNQVASPTKFSEYILAGVPVVLTDSIDDFTYIIRKTGFGYIVDDHNDIDKTEIENILNLQKLNRIEISNWGKDNFSKEAYIERYIDLIANL